MNILEYFRTNEPSLVGSDLGDRDSKKEAQSRVLKIVGEGPGLGLGRKKKPWTLTLGTWETGLNRDECPSGV